MSRKRNKVPRKRLIELRGANSQTKMAQVFGLKQQVYSHYETGYATPPPATMKAMEDYFRVPMEELFPDVFNHRTLLNASLDDQDAV
jgi:putative transcriptional regulator